MRKILYLVLALALAFSLCLTLASCEDKDSDSGNNGGDNNNNTDTKVTYTVTVKDTAGNAVKGVKVQIMDANGVATPNVATTAETGKLEFNLKAADYKVKLDKVPASYVAPAAMFNFTDKALTVTLEFKPLYTVKIVDQDGAVVTGANVQMCADSCVPLIESTAGSGLYTRYTNEDAFKAQINALPDGYSFKAGETDQTKYEFEEVDGGFYVEIEVVKN